MPRALALLVITVAACGNGNASDAPRTRLAQMELESVRALVLAARARGQNTPTLSRTPTQVPCGPVAWSGNEAWNALGYHPDYPVPFAFEVDATTARAYADRDCDRTPARFELPLTPNAELHAYDEDE